MAKRPEILLADALAGIPHGFCTAMDHADPPDPDWIVPSGQLVLLKQVHSALAIGVDAPFADAARPEVDGMATAQRGLVLGIVTADCAPVLFADVEAGVIGAAHAGWRGAIGGVLEATIAQMVQLGAQRGRIAACIGPTIAQESYEVDAAFRDRFLKLDWINEAYLAPGRDGHFQFDLPSYVRDKLSAAGAAPIDVLREDTYAQPGRFHSFRRATHRGEPTYGRQYSLIALPQL